MKCPKCGYEIEAQQNRAAKSRWANMTKAERAAEMSRIRRKGVKNTKRVARRSNQPLTLPGPAQLELEIPNNQKG